MSKNNNTYTCIASEIAQFTNKQSAEFIQNHSVLEESAEEMKRALSHCNKLLVSLLREAFPVITQDSLRVIQTVAQHTKVKRNFAYDYSVLVEKTQQALDTCRQWDKIFNGAANIEKAIQTQNKIQHEYIYLHAKRDTDRSLRDKIQFVLDYNAEAALAGKVTIDEEHIKIFSERSPWRYLCSADYRRAYDIYQRADSIAKEHNKTVLQAIYESRYMDEILPDNLTHPDSVRSLTLVFSQVMKTYKDAQRSSIRHKRIQDIILSSVAECCVVEGFAQELVQAIPLYKDVHKRHSFLTIVSDYAALHKTQEHLNVNMESAMFMSQRFDEASVRWKEIADKTPHVKFSFDLGGLDQAADDVVSKYHSTKYFALTLYSYDMSQRMAHMYKTNRGDLGSPSAVYAMSLLARMGSYDARYLYKDPPANAVDIWRAYRLENNDGRLPPSIPVSSAGYPVYGEEQHQWQNRHIFMAEHAALQYLSVLDQLASAYNLDQKEKRGGNRGSYNSDIR